ncbi:acyl-CoA dehydrogenase family protein [Salinispora vitiensis]|uniref:acyl-CoA dehydrogenase family protein n=1 Tax=Salinispora vitiensis TaxID=999544 RepID=UPI0021DFC090
MDAAAQLHGAAGLVADSVPERLCRQIRSLRIYEGTSEVQRSSSRIRSTRNAQNASAD